MKFKEFSAWCNQRAADGCWSMKTAIYCVGVCETLYAIPFWKREKLWKKDYEDYLVHSVVIPINEKIEELTRKSQ